MAYEAVDEVGSDAENSRCDPHAARTGNEIVYDDRVPKLYQHRSM